MKHLSPTELTEKAGEAVVLDGWLQTVRDQGSIVFLIIRNNQGSFQAVVLKSSAAYEASKSLTMESVIKVRGTAKLEQNAPHGVEVMVDQLEVLSLADPEIIVKEADPTDKRREIFSLTDKGLALIPLLLDMNMWSDVYGPEFIGGRSGLLAAALQKDREAVIAELTEDVRKGGFIFAHSEWIPPQESKLV